MYLDPVSVGLPVVFAVNHGFVNGAIAPITSQLYGLHRMSPRQVRWRPKLFPVSWAMDQEKSSVGSRPAGDQKRKSFMKS